MPFPFADHIALLEHFFARRRDIVEGLEQQLFGARGRTLAETADRESIAGIFDACFFESPAISGHLASLNGRLRAAHLSDGFEPPAQDGYARDLDPVELVLRASHYWDHSRWPGRNGRLLYTQGLYAVFVLRLLELLSLRIWDEGHAAATGRLEHIQRLLDLLNGDGPPHAPRMIRDARWLIQTAQGPLTRHLAPYFVTARQVAQSLTEQDRREIHKAGAVLAGGHLRSQLRHLSQHTGWTMDDPRLAALTRTSNSMDMALLIGDLVPLLEAYNAACEGKDAQARPALADAILQGLSADPELLLTRLDLLVPSTMIEDLCVERNEDHQPRYTVMGRQHAERLTRYAELIERTAAELQKDAFGMDPAHADYSPLGIVYGFCADLLANMVLNMLRTSASPNLTLEDMFTSGAALAEKRTLAREWECLPKAEEERNAFEHSTEWAVRMSMRLNGALEARIGRPGRPNASKSADSRLYAVPCDTGISSAFDSVLPAEALSAQEHCLMSDPDRARTTGGTLIPAGRMARDRAEGRFLASHNVDGVWFGVSKGLLTMSLSGGKDAVIKDVPQDVIDILRLTCPERLVVAGRS